MCMASRPKLPPPSPPPPMIVPETVDEEVQRAKQRNRRRAAAAQGRESTVLTPLSQGPASPTGQSKTLLGS